MRMMVSALALGWMLAGAAQAQEPSQEPARMAPGQPRPAPPPTTAPAAPAAPSAATASGDAAATTGAPAEQTPVQLDRQAEAARPAATPQAARPAGTPPADEEGEEIVVIGQRPFGAVIGDVKPEQQLGQAEIRSYGVSSVAELITELAPQTNAAAGPPIVLLNGKRISGFQEIRDIPPEAIQRVEILPEDVSLSYGYAANQKVVNIVLRRRFNAWTGEIGAGTTTGGGRENGRASANLLTIQNTARTNIDVTYTAAGDLRESDRNIVPTAPGRPFALAGNVAAPTFGNQIDPALSALAGRIVTVAAVPASAAGGRPTLAAFLPGANAATVDDLGRFRTLSPSNDSLAVNATFARPLSEKVAASLNTRVEFTGSDSLQGLPGLSLLVPAGNPFSPFGNPVQLYRYSDAGGPLTQAVRGTNAHVGGTLNGQVKDWFWTFTGSYDRVSSRTATQRGIDLTALQAALSAGDPTLNPFGTLPAGSLGNRLTDRARFVSSSFTGDLVASGPLFQLPAGKATSSITISGAANDFDSRSLRAGLVSDLSFSRDIIGSKANIDLPITSRRNNVLSAIGDLGLNLNGEVQRLSDYGRITSIGAGVHWTPIPAIRFIGSVTADRAAPSGQQINNPLIITPNVPVFDFRTGQTVFVSQVGGGNPGLLASERQRLRLSLTVKPWTDKDLTLTALFNDNRTDNSVGTFPTPTPQVEAAFPGRFVRDANGTLTQVDVRPVNFDRQRSTSLRYGFNFSKPIKSLIQKRIEAWRDGGFKAEDRPKEVSQMQELFQRERARRQGQPGQGQPGQVQSGQGQPGQGQSGQRGANGTPDNPPPENANDQPHRGGGGGDHGGGGFGGPGGGGGFGGGGGRGPGGGGGFGGQGGGRLQFALYHTIRLTETIDIAPGLPRLDLLDGDAITGTGGPSRNEVEAQAGYANNGIGVRLSGTWRSAVRVDGVQGAPTSSLRFGNLSTLDFRLFANLGQRPELLTKYPFLRGSRVSLAVTNLFNTRQDVRDAAGAVPLRFQPAYLDPLGRRITVSFRKVFF